LAGTEPARVRRREVAFASGPLIIVIITLPKHAALHP